MRYRLRTLLILLAALPPLLWFGWTKYEAWRAEQERRKAIEAEKARLDYLIDLATWQVKVRAYGQPPIAPIQPDDADGRTLTRPKAPATSGE